MTVITELFITSIASATVLLGGPYYMSHVYAQEARDSFDRDFPQLNHILLTRSDDGDLSYSEVVKIFNAYTHTYVSYRLSQALGTEAAKFLGDLNEIHGAFFTNDTREDARKDQWDNQIGRNWVSVFTNQADMEEALREDLQGYLNHNGSALIYNENTDDRSTGSLYGGYWIEPEAWDALKEYGNDLLITFGEIVNDYEWAIENPSELLPDWLQWVKDFWDPRKNANNADGSPLVLDLGETGIHLLDRSEMNGVYWDIDRDGFREASGWVGPEDGLLALDRNNNGVIDDNSELFGDQPASGMPNGFATLALLDTNNDGQITSADAAFGDLIVWVDGNSDGISQGEELKTLSSLGITAINLNYTNTNYTLDGNSIRQESTFTMNGQTRSIVDAWFSYDNINTEYNGDYTLDVRTLFLPDTRGYGDLPDLHIAMSQDETLLEMVQELAAQSLQQLHCATFNKSIFL